VARFDELVGGYGPNSEASQRAARAVAGGQLLAHPTSTVYGLGGLPDRLTDLRIAALKGRAPERRPILRIAPDVATALRELPDVRWDRRAELLSLAFWPGPLTLVVANGSPYGVALRVEGHPRLREVLAALDGVMSSTSLNLAGCPPATTVAEARAVLRGFGDDERPIAFLAGGELPGPPPSTLVSLLGPTAEILREGAVGASAIMDALAGLDV
jgi:L-threonylcarbamoyladenylate synthase